MGDRIFNSELLWMFSYLLNKEVYWVLVAVCILLLYG